MKGKAVDFMEKPVVQQRLLEQVQKAIASDLKNREVRSDRKQITERYERLTPREREVMWLVVDGQSSKQIASELGVSFKTIEAHRAKIMKKMQVRSVPYLIRMSLHLVKD
jgi:FixJ family two-component response regulator